MSDWNDGPHDPDESGTGDDPFGGMNLPLEQIFSMLGLPAPAPGEEFDVSALLGSLQQAMQRFGMAGTSDGRVNWDFAKDIARKMVASLGPDPTPSSRQRHEVADAVHLADLWLNDNTTFPSLTKPPMAWSRAEWVEHTMPAWQTMVEPIVSKIAQSLSNVMTQRLAEDPQTADAQSLFAPMLQQSASSMFGAQLGQALGQLASEVVSVSDVGMPLLEQPQVALLPTNLAAFGEGLELPERDVLLYLSLRESARQRLFGSVGWLGPQLLALVQHYAREIVINPDGLEESFDSLGATGDVSMDDLAELGNQMSNTLFSPSRTPEQDEILARLETLLALVEGWVDDTVDQVTTAYMPAGKPLGEVVRRRRAAGGPEEQVFASLVGLTLRPRRTRDAMNLWAAIRDARGVDGRDAVWAHPDTMPTSADLDDPLGFVADERNSAGDDFDADLAKLLDEERPEGS